MGPPSLTVVEKHLYHHVLIVFKPGTLLDNIYAIQASFLVSFIYAYTGHQLGLQKSFAGGPRKDLSPEISRPAHLDTHCRLCSSKGSAMLWKYPQLAAEKLNYRILTVSTSSQTTHSHPLKRQHSRLSARHSTFSISSKAFPASC